MKPEELRVNNWYMSTKFQTPVRCELSDMCEIYHRADGAEPDEDDVASVFKPIPLTERWLIKFGFVDNGYSFDKYPISISWGRRIISSGEKGSFYLDGDIPDDFKIMIQSVHELQNLYFILTGDEL